MRRKQDTKREKSDQRMTKREGERRTGANRRGEKEEEREREEREEGRKKSERSEMEKRHPSLTSLIAVVVKFMAVSELWGIFKPERTLRE